jgi:RNA-binding protein
MQLSTKQTSYLRGLAHHLNPVVQVGKNGYTEAVVKDVIRNLKDHELIKVRIGTDERADFVEMCRTLARDTESALVQTIGRIAVLYRPSDDPEIDLP